MDNLNILQNTFAPNSSSSTNFYTQKNFHPRQDPSLSPNNDYNNNPNQENSFNNNEAIETVSSKKRTFKNNINEYSPSSFDDKRKGKMMHLIKNSLCKRVKNNVLLKEINHAYNEMLRFISEGDLASAKMMENELNELQATVIMTNLYPITKIGKNSYNEQLYKTYNFGRSMNNTTSKSNNFYEINNSMRINRIKNNNIINEENEVEEENINQKNNNKKGPNNQIGNLNNNFENDNINNNQPKNQENQFNDNIPNNIDNKKMNEGFDNNQDNNNNLNNNEMDNAQNLNKQEEKEAPNLEQNNKLNNIQVKKQLEIINNSESIIENSKIPKKTRAIKDINNNEDNENDNYQNYEDRNIPYEYEDGMYYDQNEFEEVYGENELDERGKNKLPKQSKISQIIENSKIIANKSINPLDIYNSFQTQYFPNIQPQNDINNIDIKAPFLLVSNPKNQENNIQNSENENNPNSQTFNPSKNIPIEISYHSNQNYPYPNTLYQNNTQPQYPDYPQNNYQPNIIQSQNPQNNPYLGTSSFFLKPINNLQYPNYPENFNEYPKQMNIKPSKDKPRPKSVKSINKNITNYPKIYNNTEYPQRPVINFGHSLNSINNKFRTKPRLRRQSPANILYSKGSKGKCFACDVDCGIGRSGNSPNNYDPYMASLKKPRYDVTYYDGEKFGYYQYSSSPYLIQENN